MGTGPHLQEGDPLGGDPGPDHMGRGSPILDLRNDHTLVHTRAAPATHLEEDLADHTVVPAHQNTEGVIPGQGLVLLTVGGDGHTAGHP